MVSDLPLPDRIRYHDGIKGERERGAPTTVMVSTLSMKGSDVKYLESERVYSFQSCAKRF